MFTFGFLLLTVHSTWPENFIWTSRTRAGTNFDIPHALIGHMAPTPQTKFNIYSAVNFCPLYMNIYYPLQGILDVSKDLRRRWTLCQPQGHFEMERPSAKFRL